MDLQKQLSKVSNLLIFTFSLANQSNFIILQYKNIQATKKDVMTALEQYRAVTYRVDTYVFNDGSKKELLNLSGTIPVIYKSKNSFCLNLKLDESSTIIIFLVNTYHIPICIWLMDTHPYNAPICYVKPTPDMHIKVCLHPPGCCNLVLILLLLFQVSMYVDHNGKIYLPYLHDWLPNTSELLGLIQVMTVTFGEHPPVYSKPKETPYPRQAGSFMPQPPGVGANQTSFNAFPQNSNFPPYPTSNFGGGYPPYPPAGAAANPPYPPTGFMGSGFNQPPAQNNNATGTGTITEEHIKASLISAVEDKMRRRIQEKVNQCQAEIDTLKRTKQELKEGQSKLCDIIKKLERDEGELKKSIQLLTDKDAELTKTLETLEQNDQIDVDEAVTTTAPLYKQ
jgi:ESCRT-I complex subunit TSG101